MGWVYNLETPDPNSHVARVIGICLTFSITACLAVSLRFYVRIFVKRSVWVDDYSALFSTIMALAYASLSVAQTRWGLGLAAEYFPTQNMVPYGKVQYAGGPVYTLALLGFKVSLLSSYLRIGGFVRPYRVVIIIAIVACVCNQLAFTLLLLFACRPIARQWEPSISGTCINTVASYYALAGTSLGFDVIIIMLPFPVLMHLQLQLKQKIALVGVFALGFFVTVIQILRVFSINNLETYTDSEPIIIWSVIEVSLGVIVSCIPTYCPLFKSFASGIISRRTRASSGTYRLSSLFQKARTATSSSRGKNGSRTSRDTGDAPGNDLNLNDWPPRPFDAGGSYTTTIMSTHKGDEDSSSDGSIWRDDSSGHTSDYHDHALHIHRLMEVKIETEDV